MTKDGDSGAEYSANDFFVSLGWSYNDLDRGFFPRSGNKSSLSGKVTVPGSDNRYYKLTLDSTQYVPLNENQSWVWMEHLKAGYAGGLQGSTVPFTIISTPADRHRCAASPQIPSARRRPTIAVMALKAAIAAARWRALPTRLEEMRWRC